MCTGQRRSGALPTSGLQPGCGPHPCVGLHFSLPEALGDATGAKKGQGSSRPPEEGLDSKGLLWASTRRRRAAHRDRQLQLSNSLFWRSWQPPWSVPLGYQEDVVSTPPSLLLAPEAQGLQDACSPPPRPRSCAGKPSPRKSTETPPRGVASRRGRRVRGRAAKHGVPQLGHLAQQLRSKPAGDPQLHAAALDYAEWVEKGQIPEESLESQLAWQVLEHCSGTPGPLDLPTLAAFAPTSRSP